MKLTFLLFFTSLILGCGSGGGESTVTLSGNAPTISNLRLSRLPLSPWGQVSVSITFDYKDTDGDVAILSIVDMGPDGNSNNVTTVPMTGLEGATQGTITTTVVPKNYVNSEQYGLFLTDSRGNKSNQLIAIVTTN
jgi:hypothetical protein